jgi:hypothetical protein
MLQESIYNKMLEMGYKKENIIYEDYQGINNKNYVVIVRVVGNNFMIYSALNNGIGNVLLDYMFITDEMIKVIKKNTIKSK